MRCRRRRGAGGGAAALNGGCITKCHAGSASLRSSPCDRFARTRATNPLRQLSVNARQADVPCGIHKAAHRTATYVWRHEQPCPCGRQVATAFPGTSLVRDWRDLEAAKLRQLWLLRRERTCALELERLQLRGGDRGGDALRVG